MNFQTDFCLLAIQGLSVADARRVALALDCAIAFGAAEVHAGNMTLADVEAVRRMYAEKVARLKTLTVDEYRGRPLFVMRTWGGGYVEPARWHLALAGWARYFWHTYIMGER